MHVFANVEEIIQHLEWLGTMLSAESDEFTELDHGLQTAAILQREHADDPELQVAGLVHDLAHPWDGPGQPRHGFMGADAVRKVLGERIASLVEGHVPAKRYLVAAVPEYADVLSPDSVMTLAAQGGPMDDREVAAFEADPHCAGMVALRVADDHAKVPGAVVPSLDHWIPIIRTVAHADATTR
ncbi:MAG: HD domain-containing protein [Actinomycetota bacterium]